MEGDKGQTRWLWLPLQELGEETGHEREKLSAGVEGRALLQQGVKRASLSRF
jgi:hypothetical protein